MTARRYGPWPLMLSAILLGLLNWLILEVTGHAWSITWGFTLWAAEAAQFLGWDPQSSVFWTYPYQAQALARGVLLDDTSITNFGIILGALVAAGFAGLADSAFDGFGKPLILGIVIAIVAPLGDLSESLIKRDLGIKDMGSVLPGHGGLLDRFDALVFVLPATYYTLRVFDFI